MTIRDEDIQNAIDRCKCPEPMFCTVTTTCYDQRERMCLKCWIDYCKRNGIEIVY